MASKKAKPSDLGTGAARKAADAIVKRKKQIDDAYGDAGGGSSSTRPGYSKKTSETIDMSNPNAYRKYQLEQARKQVKKKK